MTLIVINKHMRLKQTRGKNADNRVVEDKRQREEGVKKKKKVRACLFGARPYQRILVCTHAVARALADSEGTDYADF
jgi:hypothetical protein